MGEGRHVQRKEPPVFWSASLESDLCLVTVKPFLLRCVYLNYAPVLDDHLKVAVLDSADRVQDFPQHSLLVRGWRCRGVHQMRYLADGSVSRCRRTRSAKVVPSRTSEMASRTSSQSPRNTHDCSLGHR